MSSSFSNAAVMTISGSLETVIRLHQQLVFWFFGARLLIVANSRCISGAVMSYLARAAWVVVVGVRLHQVVFESLFSLFFVDICHTTNRHRSQSFPLLSR